MKISLEWVSDYLDLPTGLAPEELARELTMKTVEVEGVTYPGAGEVPGFGDAVLEVDNKSLTNRPDLWGHYGIARELAAIYSVPLRALPSVTLAPPSPGPRLIGEIDGQVCQRFTAIAFDGVQGTAVAPSWLRSRLARIGQASVNLLVDLSNYVMYATGQPTHVYDADRIGLPLSVSLATERSQLSLVDGSTADVTAQMPVIRDAAGPVAAAGVMGGDWSAVGPGSSRFILEAASFHAQVVRLSAQRLGLRTEASARYEKGIDTQRTDAAVGLFFYLLDQVAPDLKLSAGQTVLVEPTEQAGITVGLDFLTKRIGTALEPGEITRTLAALGFEVQSADGMLRLRAPSWRSTGDISLPEDIVEEVARFHGYENLPTARLAVMLRSAGPLAARQADRAAREVLAFRAQLREVVTYAWVSDEMLAAVGWDKAKTVMFDGAPAPDQNSLRPSLVPNIIEAAAKNVRYLAEGFGIFEVGTVFEAGSLAELGGWHDALPVQPLMLAGLLLDNDGERGFRKAKGILEMLSRDGQLATFGFASYTSADTVDNGAAKWADPSARAAITVDGKAIGTLGLLTRRCERLSGLDAGRIACFELDLGQVLVRTSRDNAFESLPELPEADFDLSVVVADQVPWSHVSEVARQADSLVHRVDFRGEFRGSWVPEGYRSLTMRVTLRPKEATMSAELIASSRERVLAALRSQADARLRA